MDWTERIGRRLTPRDLHVFMSVIEAGSMAKASERLAMSRPAVSKAIAELEALVGVRLLDRIATGVAPTFYGDALLRRGRAVFDELRGGLEELATLSDPNRGIVRIGTTEVTSGSIVAATVIRLAERFPHLRFSTERGRLNLRLDLLRERRVDVFVTRPLSAEPEPDIAFDPLITERLLVVCGTDSPWVRRPGATLRDLAAEPWILAPPEVAPDGPVARSFTEAGVALPERLLLSDSLTFRYSLLATGRYLTVMPLLTLRLAPRPPWIRELDVAVRSWEIPTVIAHLRDRTLTPAAQHFIAESRRVVASVR